MTQQQSSSPWEEFVLAAYRQVAVRLREALGDSWLQQGVEPHVPEDERGSHVRSSKAARRTAPSSRAPTSSGYVTLLLPIGPRSAVVSPMTRIARCATSIGWCSSPRKSQ